jgi:hypothetical protein
MALNVKRLDDLTVVDLEAIREGWPLLEAASRNGRVGSDKALKRLRHFCNWAVEKGYANRTPFKTGNGVVAFHFAKEQPRSRRLEGDEEQRLVDNADSHLRALIIAALETACRMRESGAPDHVVAAWLGHANISTTSRYLRTSRTGLQRYLQGFEEHRERCTSVAHTLRLYSRHCFRGRPESH